MTTTEIAVLRPTDPGYGSARLGFQTHAAQRPAAVVPARSPREVVAAVRLARAEGRRLAVQATGHGVGAVDPEALLVNTGALRGVHVDPATRTARVAAGERWADVVAAAAPYGLAPLSGSAPGVGVVGYLLAGGLPILGRRHGWAAAGLRAAEVVTAGGDTLTVTADDDGLGWALRGGGGSFAVVTEVTIALVPLRRVYGGSVTLPLDDAPSVLRGWRDWAADLADPTATSLAVAPFPDVPAVPAPLHGRTAITIRLAHDGPAAEGARVAGGLRALGEPLVDDLGELPWTDSARIHRDPPGPAASVGTTVGLTALPDTVLDAALETVTCTAADAGARRVVELRRLGGALAAPTGLPLRTDLAWTAGTVAVLTGPGQAAPAAARDARFRAAVGGAGRVPSFLFGEGADPGAVRSAYRPPDWARLRAVKADVDPDDLILAAAPVPPAA